MLLNFKFIKKNIIAFLNAYHNYKCEVILYQSVDNTVSIQLFKSNEFISSTYPFDSLAKRADLPKFKHFVDAVNMSEARMSLQKYDMIFSFCEFIDKFLDYESSPFSMKLPSVLLEKCIVFSFNNEHPYASNFFKIDSIDNDLIMKNLIMSALGGCQAEAKYERHATMVRDSLNKIVAIGNMNNIEFVNFSNLCEILQKIQHLLTGNDLNFMELLLKKYSLKIIKYEDSDELRNNNIYILRNIIRAAREKTFETQLNLDEYITSQNRLFKNTCYLAISKTIVQEKTTKFKKLPRRLEFTLGHNLFEISNILNKIVLRKRMPSSDDFNFIAVDEDNMEQHLFEIFNLIEPGVFLSNEFEINFIKLIILDNKKLSIFFPKLLNEKDTLRPIFPIDYATMSFSLATFYLRIYPEDCHLRFMIYFRRLQRILQEKIFVPSTKRKSRNFKRLQHYNPIPKQNIEYKKLLHYAKIFNMDFTWFFGFNDPYVNKRLSKFVKTSNKCDGILDIIIKNKINFDIANFTEPEAPVDVQNYDTGLPRTKEKVIIPRNGTKIYKLILARFFNTNKCCCCPEYISKNIRKCTCGTITCQKCFLSTMKMNKPGCVFFTRRYNCSICKQRFELNNEIRRFLPKNWDQDGKWCKRCKLVQTIDEECIDHVAELMDVDGVETFVDPNDETDFECGNCANDECMKICPKCGNGVIKTEGCNHITCICGAHWCFACSGLFEQNTIYHHMKAAHGSWYSEV